MENKVYAYIRTYGEVLREDRFIGCYEGKYEAKLAAFEEMDEGDHLLLFSEKQALIKDGYGICDIIADNPRGCANFSWGEDDIILRYCDGSYEDIPEGWWFWNDDDEIDENYRDTWEREKGNIIRLDAPNDD